MAKKRSPAKKKVANKAARRSAASKKSATSSKPRAAKKAAYRSAGEKTKTGAPIAIVEDNRGRSALFLRSRLGMNREAFSRLVPTSVRSLASIEAGKQPSDSVMRRLKELRRVVDAIAKLIKKDAVGPWLEQPNDAFDGLKPMEVIERGEVDRIWEMVYFLRSGVPA